MSCVRGNKLAMQRQCPDEVVDLEKLRPVTIAEVAQSADTKWNARAKPPELFEQWWSKSGDKNWSVKHAAREAWYACAESLGVYDS